MTQTIDKNQPYKIWLRIRNAQGKIQNELIDDSRTKIIIGRHSSGSQVADLTIEDKLVSGRHCELFWNASDGNWWINDLNSTNGTKINSELLKTPTPLGSGDNISLGSSSLLFINDTEQEDDANKTLIVSTSSLSSINNFGQDKTELLNIHHLNNQDDDNLSESSNLNDDSNDTQLEGKFYTSDKTVVASPEIKSKKIHTEIKAGVDAKLEIKIIYQNNDINKVTTEQHKLEYSIGRDFKNKGSQSDFLINDEYASRRHCRIFWQEATGWMVEELN